MFRSSRLRSALLLSAIGLVALLTGCGKNTEPASTNSSAPATSPAATPQSATNTPRKKLNVNTASEPELLAAIPGLGNRMVHEFEEYRPYRSILQFRKEIGKYVSPDKVAEYEQYIFVPINPNESDAATLQQMPGLDSGEAESLIAGRPYASQQAFLEKLAERISAADLDAAKTLLGT